MKKLFILLFPILFVGFIFVYLPKNTFAVACGTNECAQKGDGWYQCLTDTYCCYKKGCPSGCETTYGCATITDANRANCAECKLSKCAACSGTNYPEGGGGDGDGNGNGGGGACKTQTFVSASVAPSTLRPYDEVTVKCNYGKRLDCLSIAGAGLTGCRYSRYEGTDNIFVCAASANAGYYDDAKCVLSKGTKDNCCAASNTSGNMTILGTDVNYDQKLILPFGKYTFSARVLTGVSQGKGVRVTLVCDSDTCANSTKQNATVYHLDFPETKEYVEKKDQLVTLTGTGDDRHYIFRISVDRGSEAFFDYVSMKNASGKELIQNGDFTGISQGTINTSQPVGWGEGDNRVGYYYGSLMTSSGTTNPNIPTPTISNPVISPTSGPVGSGSATLAMKIKIQGITKKPANSGPLKVQVKLGGGGLSAATAYQTVSFTVNDAGEWSGQATFDKITNGGGYKVYIKGPKQLQKKICDSAPTESKAGAYHCADGKITLVSGTNTLDFSKIVVLSGDLPETGGKQNGIIDSYDTTFIRQNLGSTDSTKLTTGDLNLDNIIDTQDYSIVLQALSIKYDEE